MRILLTWLLTSLVCMGQYLPVLEFDGVDGEIQIADDNSLSFSNSYTATLWVNFSDLTDNYVILAKGANAPSQVEYALQYNVANNAVSFYSWKSGSAKVLSGTTYGEPPTNQWVHIAGA